MSRGVLAERLERVDTDSPQRISLITDLKHLWEIVKGEVNGDLVWASDTSLRTTVKLLRDQMKDDSRMGAYLKPGNLRYPTHVPVPAFGVKVGIPMLDAIRQLMLNFNPWGLPEWFVPMVVYSKPKRFQETRLEGYRLKHEKTAKGKKPIEKYNTLDGLLHHLTVPEAFVIELGVFVPMAGPDASYETQFFPSAYCVNGDYKFTTVFDSTVMGNRWVGRKGHRVNIEDISNPDDPKFYKATPRGLGDTYAGLADTSNQMIVIAQSGNILDPEAEEIMQAVLAPPNPRCGNEGGTRFYSPPNTSAAAIDAPRIEEGASSGTQTRSVEFKASSYPAVVYHMHIFSVMRTNVPSVNPQRFSEVVAGMHR